MNPANSKFLLNWINANASSEEEKVSNIKDAASKNLLLKILHLIDKETSKDLPRDSEAFEVEQVLSMIISYLGGFHHQSFESVINEQRLKDRDETETGKVITLLLCGATQCDNVAVFVDQITQMDVEDQFSFKFLIESVLTDMEQGSLTSDSFATILSKKANLTECHKLEHDTAQLPSPLSVQSPIEAFFTNSPLKSLVASPQLRNKQNQLMLNKLQQKVTKLQSSLDLQMHMQSELESELKEKNKEIDARDATIIELRKEITKLMSTTDELELMRHFRHDFEKADKENARALNAASNSAQMKTETQRAQEIEVDDIVLEQNQLCNMEDDSPSHVPIAPVNIDSRIIELELEKCRLESQLSTAVNQEEFLALKETLEDTKEAQTSYKENYVAAKSRIQELEEQLAVELQKSEQKDEQLRNIQEQCFHEVEELKTVLMSERSMKAELAEELDVREKRLQQTTVEIQALSSLKAGLEGSLQTSNARALDEKVKYDREMSLRNGEMNKMSEQIQRLEKDMENRLQQIQALEQERDHVRDTYEQMMAGVKNELDLKINSMAEDKAATVAQFRLRTQQLEEEHEKMKEEFASKQKAMLEEAEKNAAKIQEACDADRAAWKKKFDQLSEEVMNTRSEMFENSKKHSEELIEVRKKAREAEELLDEEARKNREEKVNLENQLLKAKSAMAELEMEVKRGEVTKKELEDERKKYDELKGRCEGYVAKVEALELNTEQLKKEAESEKERVKKEMQQLVEANKTEVDTARQALENLKRDYSELEIKRKEEIEKILQEEKEIKDGLTLQIKDVENISEEKGKRIEELETLLKKSMEEKNKRVENLETMLKESQEEEVKRVEELEKLLKDALEEKENAVSQVKNAQIKWENRQQELQAKIEDLEGASEEMKEAEIAFAELKDHMLELQTEKDRLEQKVQEESLINKRLGTEVHSLEAQLTHADRQIRELKLDSADNKNKMDSLRRKTIGGARAQRYIQDVFEEEDSSTESDEGPPLMLDDFANSLGGSMKATTLPDGAFNKSNRSLTSLHSASSSSLRAGVQTRASRRQSAIYMRGNTPPERRTTNSAAFFILGDGLRPEMEQDAEYDWTRLAELQRRNASCLPHLQTSYPVETQMQPDISGQEDALKTGRMSLDASLTKTYNTRKRKSEESASSMLKTRSHGSSLPKSKSAPNITPAKQPRSQRLVTAMQSAFGSLRSRSNENLSHEAPEQDENSSRRESVAYNIEISPPKKEKSGIARRRTIARSTGTSRLLGEKTKDSLKKSKTQQLRIDVIQRKPLRPRDVKRNVK
ncbi:myosin-15-like [Orbicella faveolata]|uniref:myosin-15-like n=1 Tax=Orbicella faveolata TaxID=48498 RepID=UPI0009E4EA85|nr:myosin-15-like [Orbicella faveolata]